jgi:hypothetical protein
MVVAFGYLSVQRTSSPTIEAEVEEEKETLVPLFPSLFELRL